MFYYLVTNTFSKTEGYTKCKKNLEMKPLTIIGQ